MIRIYSDYPSVVHNLRHFFEDEVSVSTATYTSLQ